MYSADYEAALTWIADRHAGQRRRVSQIPYWVHLVHVARILAAHGYDEPVQIAGLFHDLLEDTCRSDAEAEALADAIEARFGARVRRAVCEATEAKRDAAGGRLPWRARKEAFLAQLEAAGADGLAVVTADKLHNVASLRGDLETHGEAVWARFHAGAEASLWFYREVARIAAA
ncbi:MAG: bifunctional (p)ppGpp synthetase/guanosine-3',5'-bis(diphosphate) 3'-pyrophosphohydrolase, partial [Deltaproteobacteria bacterium]